MTVVIGEVDTAALAVTRAAEEATAAEVARRHACARNWVVAMVVVIEEVDTAALVVAKAAEQAESGEGSPLHQRAISLPAARPVYDPRAYCCRKPSAASSPSCDLAWPSTVAVTCVKDAAYALPAAYKYVLYKIRVRTPQTIRAPRLSRLP